MRWPVRAISRRLKIAVRPHPGGRLHGWHSWEKHAAALKGGVNPNLVAWAGARQCPSSAAS
jgi:hypothetical protein